MKHHKETELLLEPCTCFVLALARKPYITMQDALLMEGK